MPVSRGAAGGGPKSPGHPGGGSAPAAPTIGEVVERVVGRFDGDEDDVITLEELLAVLDPQGTRSTLAERAGAALELVDTDDSGGISVVELSAAVTALDTDGDGALERGEQGSGDNAATLAVLLRGHGPGPGARGGQGSASVDALTDRVFTRFDADGNSVLTLAELVAVLDRHGRSTAEAEADASALLAKVDADADQRLTEAEVERVISAADTDADGLVEWAEFVALPDELVPLVGLVPHGLG